MALPTPLQAFSGVPKINTAPDKQTIVDGEKMTGAQALIRSLEDLGVEDVFGIPGGAILPSTTRSKTTRSSASCLCATSRPPATPPKATHWPLARWACAS